MNLKFKQELVCFWWSNRIITLLTVQLKKYEDNLETRLRVWE